MSVAEALLHSADKPAGKRPYFMTPEVERVFGVLMAVSQELGVARQRVDTLERVLEAHGLIARAELDSFAPSPDQYAERSLWTQEYLNRIMRPILQEAQAAQVEAEPPVDQISREIAVGA